MSTMLTQDDVQAIFEHYAELKEKEDPNSVLELAGMEARLALTLNKLTLFTKDIMYNSNEHQFRMRAAKLHEDLINFKRYMT